MQSTSKEANLILAIQALKQDSKLTVRAAARIYNVTETTLRGRRAGKPSRRDSLANLRKLTDSEEDVLLERIIDLDSRGFQPRLCDIQDMADRLLALRDASRVGPRWAEHFVRRHDELTMRFRRQIDYQRTKCEDPVVIGGWFMLVRNTIAKYGIPEKDIYNFDETGFLMGMLSHAKVVTSSERRGRPRTKQPGNREYVSAIMAISSDGWIVPPYLIVKGQYHLLSWYTNGQFPEHWRVRTSANGWTTDEISLEWLVHFEQVTRPRTTGVYRLLILDGHGSHHTDKFEDYCKANNIITLCMPPHSSHKLQPLDVGCFSSLKDSYGRAIERMMRMQITHITKDDFFPAFKEAYSHSMTAENAQAGFRATGLVPFSPDEVLSRLDFVPRTPTPQSSCPGTASTWIGQTPNNPTEAAAQTTLIKNRIAHHRNSSPTNIYSQLDSLTKSTTKVMQKMALMEQEILDLRMANELLSKRRRAKKTRLRQGGSLSQQEAEQIQEERGLAAEGDGITRGESGRTEGAGQRVRRCKNCGKTRYNVRTCQVVWETSEDEDFV